MFVFLQNLPEDRLPYQTVTRVENPQSRSPITSLVFDWAQRRVVHTPLSGFRCVFQVQWEGAAEEHRFAPRLEDSRDS